MISSSFLVAAGSSLAYGKQNSTSGKTAPQHAELHESPPEPTMLPASSTHSKSATRPGALLQSVNHGSGIPLGGIGTGFVELMPDGALDNWLIFNSGSWSPDQDSVDGGSSEPGMDDQALQFFLRAQPSNGPVMLRRLSVRRGEQDLYDQSWIKPVLAIDYDGKFPVANLDYLDSSLPVAISGQYFSPIIPHDAQTSGTPGFYAIFTIKNTSREIVDVSLTGRLKNPLARGDDQSLATRKLNNTIVQSGKTTFLTMRTDADIPKKTTLGSLGLSVTGGTASWISADFGHFFEVDGDAFNPCPKSVFELLRAEGKLPNLGDSGCPANILGPDVKVDDLSEAELDSALATLNSTASTKLWIDHRSKRLKLSLDTIDGKRHAAHQLQDMLNRLAGNDRKATRWGDGALCSSITLQPGETREIAFTFGWFFPHHLNALGPENGHRYQEWFTDAEQVNQFLVNNMPAHRGKVTAFADNMASSSLDPEISFCWNAQLSTLVTSSWWTRDNKFAIWEGIGCCGLQTMDITYQGSFPIVALYPELQKAQMMESAGLQRDDGRIPHNFAHNLYTCDNGFDRVDMNPQFVMLVCRDWLWTADDAYLQSVFPHVVNAMDSMAVMDTDKDGLPEKDTSRNTYDQWALRGTPAYISNLWLGALPSAIRMAAAVGDTAHEASWKSWLDMATESFDKKLWNGEYYSLWVDGDDRDDCCMTDQFSGIWFSHISGLNSPIHPDRIRETLKTILKYNFKSEQGLVNASYPPDRLAYEPSFYNFQAIANWTGIEYANAALAIDFGLVNEGLEIIRAVDDRYRRAGQCWNHIECGDHYYRAMSSWSTLLALTGFKVDAPAGIVSILPVVRQPRFLAPWVSSTGWGNLELAGQTLKVKCLSGSLNFQHLAVNIPGQNLVASVDGKSLSPLASRNGAVTSLDFKAKIGLSAGQTLTVRV